MTVDQWGCPLGVSWHTPENCKCSAPGEPLTAGYVMEVYNFASRQPETTDPRWSPVVRVCESHERLRARLLAANSALRDAGHASPSSDTRAGSGLDAAIEQLRAMPKEVAHAPPGVLEERSVAWLREGAERSRQLYMRMLCDSHELLRAALLAEIELRAAEGMNKPNSSVARDPLSDDAMLDAFQRACEECIETPFPEKYDALPKRDKAREAIVTALASARAAKDACECRECRECGHAKMAHGPDGLCNLWLAEGDYCMCSGYASALDVERRLKRLVSDSVLELQSALSEATRRAEDIREIARPFVDALSDSIAHQALRAIFARAALPEETRHGTE